MSALQTRYKALSQSSLFVPVALAALLVVANIVLQPSFLRPHVIRSNLLTFSPLILVAMGQAVILIGGNLDLSMGFGISLLNCFIAMNMSVGPGAMGHNAAILGAGLAIALGMGAANGILVGMLRVPSFMATFATSFIWLGVAIMIAPIPGGAVPRWFAQFFKASFGPANVMLLVVVLSALAWYVVRRYRLGRYIYAIGSSWDASYANGIPVNRITIGSYAVGWCFVYLGTLALTAQTRAGDSAIGEPFALNSIAAAVIGGVSLSGGSGSPVGAIFGAITLSIVMNIIYFSGLPTSYQVLVRGLIIIAALGSTIVVRSAEARRP